MIAVVARRVLLSIPLLLLVSVGVFSLVAFLPGDPAVAIAGQNVSAERAAHIHAQLRLDEPFLVRYGLWLGDLLQGELGESIVTRRPIADEILRRLPVTMSVGAGTIVVALALGVPFGLLQGLFPGGALDRGLLLTSSLGLAVPNFWLATILVGIFSVSLGWLPAIGYVPLSEDPGEWLKRIILPSLSLGVFAAAELARQLRAGLVQISDQDYVRAAWAKGMPARTVIGKHVLKNAAVPAVTVLGIRVGHLLSGAVIVEYIFSLPGLGMYAIDAIFNRDFTAIQAIVLAAAVIIIIVNLLVDLVYAYLNPKVRLS